MDEGVSGRPHIPRNNQDSEVITDQNKMCAYSYQLHNSPMFSAQTTTGQKFRSNCCSSIMSNSGNSFPCIDHRCPDRGLLSPSSGGNGNNNNNNNNKCKV